MKYRIKISYKEDLVDDIILLIVPHHYNITGIKEFNMEGFNPFNLEFIYRLAEHDDVIIESINSYE